MPVLTPPFRSNHSSPPAGNPPEERQLCLKCLRAQAVCYCADLRPFALPFQLVILQHPKERKNSIGTARLTHLSIQGSLLLGGVGFDEDPRVNALLDDPSNQCFLLYPGPEAIDLTRSGDSVFAPDKKLVIFVIDGTWAHAKTMLRKSERLRALPRVAFESPAPSRYQVRRQPHPACLSTVEAVHRMVQLLRPTPQADTLIEIFQKIVRQQVEFAANQRLREIRGKRVRVAEVSSKAPVCP